MRIAEERVKDMMLNQLFELYEEDQTYLKH